MSLIHSPRIVTDGLKLVLDAGVPTSWNTGISTNWTDKFGGNNGTLVGGTHHNDGPFVGAGYVEFDGTGDYLSITDSTDFDFGSGDFTIEFFLYSASFSNYTGILGKRNAETDYAPLLIDTDNSAQKKVRFLTSTTGSSWISITSSSAFPLSQWVHVAVVRSGSTITLYENGVSKGSASISGSIISNSAPVFVGAGVLTIFGSARLNGFLSNLRILKGTALYTSDFTVPTKQLTAITNTVLLTCQGNTIADASSSAHTITANDNAAANLGSPASAFEFDGSNDYVQVPNSSALQLGTGDFTIEMWWYMIGSGNCRGFTLGDAYDANGMELYLGSSGTSLNVYIENATRITADSVPSFDTWHHYVIERTSGTMKLYIDGVVQSGTYSSSQSLGTGTDGDLRIGVEYYNGGLSFVGDCKISNFKIYKGKGFTATEVLQNYNALKGRYA